MYRSLHARALSAGLVALVALAACSDQTSAPTSVPSAPPATSHRDIFQFDTSTNVAISTVNLASTTFTIGDPASLLRTTTISKIKSFYSYNIRAYFVQGLNVYPAFDERIGCGEGQIICNETYHLLLPAGVKAGPARLVLDLIFRPYNTTTQTATINVTIAGTQSISALTAASSPIAIGGPASPFVATFKNTDVDLSNASVQGYIIEGETSIARRVAASGPVQCGSGSGVLPTGTCTFASTFSASNAMAGSGTLLPGSALFELDLIVGTNIVAKTTALITLGSSASIPNVTLSSSRGDTTLIEGASVAYIATLKNIGTSMTGLSLETHVVQGSVHRFGGSAPLACTATSGVLPNGSCAFAAQFNATNNTAGEGTLVTGAATLQLKLVDASGLVWATTSVPLTLIEGPLVSPMSGPGENIVRLRKP